MRISISFALVLGVDYGIMDSAANGNFDNAYKVRSISYRQVSMPIGYASGTLPPHTNPDGFYGLLVTFNALYMCQVWIEDGSHIYIRSGYKTSQQLVWNVWKKITLENIS